MAERVLRDGGPIGSPRRQTNEINVKRMKNNYRDSYISGHKSRISMEQGVDYPNRRYSGLESLNSSAHQQDEYYGAKKEKVNSGVLLRPSASQPTFQPPTTVVQSIKQQINYGNNCHNYHV